jgi:hypothetical protein
VAVEDLEVSNLGWNKFGHITIEENGAAPLMIVGIFGQVSAENV